MGKPELLFLGADAAVPPPGGETASYLLDGEIMIDLGWNATARVRQYGHDPSKIHTLILTHGHHDHYMGLPQFFFYRKMTERKTAPAPLRIFGPAEDIGAIVESALAFLQWGGRGHGFEEPEPFEIMPLSPGDGFTVGDYRVTTCAGVHPVAALCYRFDHQPRRASAVICSDTALHPPIADFAQDARVLIHEASHGAGPTPSSNAYGHSSAIDAATIAREAGVGRLYLVHMAENAGAEAVTAARDVFPETRAAQAGERLHWA